MGRLFLALGNDWPLHPVLLRLRVEFEGIRRQIACRLRSFGPEVVAT